jgi:hypothetical protein
VGCATAVAGRHGVAAAPSRALGVVLAGGAAAAGTRGYPSGRTAPSQCALGYSEYSHWATSVRRCRHLTASCRAARGGQGGGIA